jgi:GNAT superfamily N-acetyltransferase
VVAPESRRHGVAAALLREAERRLAAAGVHRGWLVTTNDNLGAIALYGRNGWYLSALHAGAVDEVRRTLKPGIALIAENGLPIRDELVFSKRF